MGKPVSEIHTHTHTHTQTYVPQVIWAWCRYVCLCTGMRGGHRLHLACGYEVRFGVWVALGGGNY